MASERKTTKVEVIRSSFRLVPLLEMMLRSPKYRSMPCDIFPKLRTGYCVKLCVEAVGLGVPAPEEIWVAIRMHSRRGRAFDGVVLKPVERSAYHGVSPHDRIEFRHEHILDVAFDRGDSKIITNIT